MFASDIHGSAYYCGLMLDKLKEEKADKLILLGDLLYHGPRNDLPKEYNPKKVIKMLNENKEYILAVRGNCDAQVDQMVLEMPIMAEYALIMYDNKRILATHGHTYSYKEPLPLMDGDIFIQGHTHILMAQKKDNNIFLNPGSVSLPKEGNPPTYAIIEKNQFLIKNFENDIIKTIDL